MAYRKAITLSVVGREVQLEQADQAFVRLSEVGGISTAELVTLEPPATVGAVNHHAQAARAAVSLARSAFRGFGGSTDGARALMLPARLWLLTLRHVFSIAEKTFPSKIDTSLAMLAIGCLLLGKGAGALVRRNAAELWSYLERPPLE